LSVTALGKLASVKLEILGNQFPTPGVTSLPPAVPSTRCLIRTHASRCGGGGGDGLMWWCVLIFFFEKYLLSANVAECTS
jgi:hypothetical protein